MIGQSFGIRGIGQSRRLMSSFGGPREKWIREKIKTNLKPSHLEVLNESHGRQEDESHFFVCVVSEQFASKNLLQRHRIVNSVLMTEEGILPFHALRITAKTPNEWQLNNQVPAAPSCQGGDGRGKSDFK